MAQQCQGDQVIIKLQLPADSKSVRRTDSQRSLALRQLGAVLSSRLYSGPDMSAHEGHRLNPEGLNHRENTQTQRVHANFSNS